MSIAGADDLKASSSKVPQSLGLVTIDVTIGLNDIILVGVCRALLVTISEVFRRFVYSLEG